MAIKGNPVDKATVPDRVKNAALLAFIWKDDDLAAISAIKKPTENYKNCVFKKAGISERSSTYSRELGYVQTHTEYRRSGLSGEIVHAIIKKNGGRPVFATTENTYMKRILESNGFTKIGSEYLAKDGKGLLSLFVR
jgi:predicted GNAT family N-acyltransferase